MIRRQPVQEIALDSNGHFVHVRDVMNGDACGCTCPICGEPLRARHGHGGKRAHFAHRPEYHCQWQEYVRQTDLHWRAEQIFLREKEISLPPLTQTFGNVNCLMFTGGTYPITAVTLEKRISDFIPDIVLQLGEATLLVEIYVTHAVDEEKKLKIVQAGQYDVIEIDLSDKVHDDITDDELRLLIHDQARVHWIHSTATSFYTRNLASVAMSYPVEGPQQMVAGCPLGKMTHVQRRLPDCSRCRFFLGTDSGNAARCLLAAHLASRAGQSMPPLPRLWNVEKQYDEIPRQKVEPAVRPTTISRRQERPFYGTRNMSRKKYRKLVNAGKIRL